MDVFKGAISWISFLLLLCGLTTGLLFLLFIALDPQLAGGLGEAIVNLTYGDYPRWLPVAVADGSNSDIPNLSETSGAFFYFLDFQNRSIIY